MLNKKKKNHHKGHYKKKIAMQNPPLLILKKRCKEKRLEKKTKAEVEQEMQTTRQASNLKKMKIPTKNYIPFSILEKGLT
jgi:hypothetical protein